LIHIDIEVLASFSFSEVEFFFNVRDYSLQRILYRDMENTLGANAFPREHSLEM